MSKTEVTFVHCDQCGKEISRSDVRPKRGGWVEWSRISFGRDLCGQDCAEEWFRKGVALIENEGRPGEVHVVEVA